MKKIFLIFCLAYIGSCFSQTRSSYSLLSGTIGKYPITMHLHQHGHDYLGYYYYNSTEQPVYFTGDDTSIKNKIQLTTLTGADVTEHFIFSVNDKKEIGNWEQEQNNKVLNVSLSENQMPLQFTFQNVQGEMPLRKQFKDSPKATFEASSVWSTGNSATDLFIQSAIKKIFGDSSSQKNISDILEENKQQFFKDYIQSNSAVKKEDLGASLNYEETNDLIISYQSASLLSLAFDTYAFTGGAHGNHGTVYTSYDLIDNRQLKLSDILNSAGIEKLQSLLEDNFRKQNNLKATDSLTTTGLFENEIKPNNNFYVTGKGIDFAYTPYEIAPYVIGEIETFISFKDLTAYLQPLFQTLIK